MRGKQMRQANPGLLLAAAVLTLAGCAAQQDVASADAAAHEPGAHAAAGHSAVPGGATRWGDSIATMADQYRPRTNAGPVAAGAVAWVKPSPSPAFVLTAPLPPAAPPAPPPAAVANRQPAAAPPPPAAVAARPPVPAPAPAPARPVVAASDIVRPEAAAPEPAPAAPDPAVRTRGLALFNDYSCGACHTLADARGAGSIGPSFDRNPRLTKAYAVDVITTGRGAMPSFDGQMTEAEIAALAEYIVQFSRK